jgi:NitT/TauT family transport system ATP-binding protein
MLNIRDLSFSFGLRRILADINLRCENSEIVGIVGRSGVGKSTILNVAAGILQCESGGVLVGGVPPESARTQQKIGYLFQAPNLLPWLTTQENVALPLQLRTKQKGVDRSESLDAVQSILRTLEIADASDKYPHELSGGMQTRAAMARALVYHPQLLLMDEPFNALDDVVKESLYQEFQNIILKAQIASVLVTHNLSEAVFLCDRVYVLGTEVSTAPSRFIHCETIPFDRPRGTNLLNDPLFAAVRSRVREALI